MTFGQPPRLRPDEDSPAGRPVAHAEPDLASGGADDRPPAAKRSAELMIIRAWLEPGSAAPLRARVRIVADVTTGAERTVTLSQADDVCATVKRWLTDISGQAEPQG